MATEAAELNVRELAKALYHYPNVEHLSEAKAKERREYLARFPTLHPEIVAAAGE